MRVQSVRYKSKKRKITKIKKSSRRKSSQRNQKPVIRCTSRARLPILTDISSCEGNDVCSVNPDTRRDLFDSSVHIGCSCMSSCLCTFQPAERLVPIEVGYNIFGNAG